MNAFEYLEPHTLEEAARYRETHADQARLIAGGTDLIVQMQAGRHRPEKLIYLGAVPELREVSWDPQAGLRVGATVSLRQVENHPAVKEHYPALARGAREVGSVQIRNLGTLAGNVCNASPSADTSPALLAYDAAVEVVSARNGTRTLAVSDFWKGPGLTALQPDELVSAVLLPAPDPARRSFYYKLAVRKAMDLAMVGIAVSLVPTAEGARDVRIALGAVGPVCFRATEAESAVERGGRAAIEEAAALAQAAASPISDQRASAAYRREMARVLTARALGELLL